MTYVVGDATHLRGIPLSGSPSHGDALRYDGETIAFTPNLTLAESELSQSRRNIQLLFMQQSIAENMARRDAVDGFYDAFQDQTGIDTDASTYSYDAGGEFCESPPEPTGPVTIDFSDEANFDRFDAKGAVSYWYQDTLNTGHFEGAEAGFDIVAVTSESGGTMTGFPAAGHGLTTGMKVRFYGFDTSAFNAIHTVDAATTTDKVVVAVAYSAETMDSSCKHRRVLTLGAEQECPDVVVGLQVDLGSDVPRDIIAIDDTTKGAGTGKVTLNREVTAGNVSGMYGTSLWYGSVAPHRGRSVPVGTWSNPDPATKPAARILTRMAFDPVGQRVWLHAGSSYADGAVVYRNDLWAFDTLTGSWTEFSPSGTLPSPRRCGFMEYDPVNHALFSYSGEISGGRINDTWKYDISANTWTDLSPATTPTTGAQCDGGYDPVNHCMWIFGGRTADTAVVTNELWKYDIGANTWTQITPSGSSPSARDGVAVRYDGVTHCLWLFGGWEGAVTLKNDVWKYDISANTWTEMSPSGTPPSARRLACRGFDARYGDLYVYSGAMAWNEMVGGFFKYNVMTNTWTELSVTNGPFDRGRGEGEFDYRNGKFYTGFGGDATYTVNQYNDFYEYDVYSLRGPSASAVCATTDETQVDAGDMLHVSTVSVAQTTPGLSTTYHAVSFDGRVTWLVRANDAWRRIVRREGGAWQYRDEQGAWEAAAENAMLHALRQAFAVGANLMTGEQLESITQSQWDDGAGFSPQVDTIDFAAAMGSDDAAIPALVRYEVTWTTGLDLVSTAKSVAAAPSRMCASVLVKNKNDSTRVSVSTDDGETWIELTGVSQAAALANGVFHYASNWTAVPGGEQIRVRVSSEAGHGTEVHGWAVAYGG